MRSKKDIALDAKAVAIKTLETCVHGYIGCTCRQCQVNLETLAEAYRIKATVGCRDITWPQQRILAAAARVLTGKDA